jgi:flagellar biogenesis protein FliO
MATNIKSTNTVDEENDNKNRWIYLSAIIILIIIILIVCYFLWIIKYPLFREIKCTTK